jgi:D-alanyl-D-alanine carboxypeptidase/D-alanyl-D-alanine-endopeptidase (penicillin-binding protein 4)
VSSRLVLVLVLAVVGPRQAWSQGTGSDDDEAGAGSGSALVAPKDSKARGDWLREKLAAAIAARPALGHAKISALVIDLGSGHELFAHAPDEALNLASNAKLLTTTAALETLGSGFRWRTAVFADDLDDATGIVRGNLYVRGRGDPTLAATDLRALADDVAARGVRAIDGQLVVDASYFDTDVDPPHFADQPKERAGYRAPVASFGVAKSAVTVTVTGVPGADAVVRVEPDAGDYVRLVKADVKTDDTKPTKIEVKAKPKKDHLELEVTGVIRVRDGSWDHRFRVDDPARFAGEVLRAALVARGVKIGRAIGSGPVPVAAKPLAQHESAPLSLVVREMNKLSDNYVAESLLKTIGAETRATPGAATWNDGLTAVRAALAKLGLPPTYRYENGSGLYAATAISARQLVAVLRAAHADFRIGPDLVASLPVGGEDGTLAKRWHGRAAAGRVRAKTGTLDAVVTLAGFVGVDGDHLLAFAILANDIPAGQRSAERAMADDMVDAMVAYLTAGISSPP